MTYLVSVAGTLLGVVMDTHGSRLSYGRHRIVDGRGRPPDAVRSTEEDKLTYSKNSQCKSYAQY